MPSRKMLIYQKRILGILFHLSTIMIIGGLLLFIPFIVGMIYKESMDLGRLLRAFIIPGLSSVLLGFILRAVGRVHSLSLRDSMFICTFSWILISLVGSIPFMVMLNASFVNAYFETMSGFTTTGITVFTGLDAMPRSILFWRAMTQWIGGLGILSMFILIGFKGGAAANKLFMAEGHKIAAEKPSPGFFRTARILWMIYIGFTFTETALLMLAGLNGFDALTHAFTTISTGGYSIHDQSIVYFQTAGYRHFHLIEIIILVFMVFGGINFFTHYRLVTGKVKALWDSTEMRFFWGILFGVTGLMFLSRMNTYGMLYNFADGRAVSGLQAVFLHFKDIGFQVASILTTTGYATRDINSPYFTAIAKQLFLVLMVIGGCAGSTGGGFKVIRIAILSKLVKSRLFKINTSRLSKIPLIIDNAIVAEEELKRIAALFFMWIVLLVIGGSVTAFFSNLNGWQSFSGMFSALGNIGPCYFSVEEMIQLQPVVKWTYIFGMLAGRLEILPVLLIFNRRFYK